MRGRGLFGITSHCGSSGSCLCSPPSSSSIRHRPKTHVLHYGWNPTRNLTLDYVIDFSSLIRRSLVLTATTNQSNHDPTSNMRGCGNRTSTNMAALRDDCDAPPRPLVICGPSGSGKSTLLKRVMSAEPFQDKLAFSVSHTTRGPRAGEKDGVDYNFSSRAAMEAEILAGHFVEHAEFSGNLYGTSKKAIEDCQNKGKICVLDIDSQGVKSMKNTEFRPYYVFIQPPSIRELEIRLRNRKTETEESLQKRLETAKQEMKYGEEDGNFDTRILNQDLDTATALLENVVKELILNSTQST